MEKIFSIHVHTKSLVQWIVNKSRIWKEVSNECYDNVYNHAEV